MLGIPATLNYAVSLTSWGGSWVHQGKQRVSKGTIFREHKQTIKLYQAPEGEPAGRAMQPGWNTSQAAFCGQ